MEIKVNRFHWDKHTEPKNESILHRVGKFLDLFSILEIV
jgi:hypothetical protein